MFGGDAADPPEPPDVCKVPSLFEQAQLVSSLQISLWNPLNNGFLSTHLILWSESIQLLHSAGMGDPIALWRWRDPAFLWPAADSTRLSVPSDARLLLRGVPQTPIQPHHCPSIRHQNQGHHHPVLQSYFRRAQVCCSLHPYKVNLIHRTSTCLPCQHQATNSRSRRPSYS